TLIQLAHSTMPDLRVLFAALLCLNLVLSLSLDGQLEELPLHRIARTPNTALLVPFPRVGKRGENERSAYDDQQPGQIRKRLYFARVGKRYMYAARVGK
ncbi:hypothetical protein PFISCL1PPCAC_27970, partial [Pristionchus fissidentatus]